MAAYNPAGSLVWSAALNVSSFNASAQSMIAQMALAQRAANGLETSLKSIAAVGFAAVVIGIGSITAAIYTSTKAAADWETQMMGISRVSIPNFDYSTPEGKQAFTAQSREYQNLYMNIPLQNRESLTKASEPYALAGFEGEALYNLTEQTLKMVKATNYEVTPDDVANMIIKSAQINREQSGIDLTDSVQRTEKMTQYSSEVMDKVLTVANKYTIGAADLTDAIVDASGSAVLRGSANDIDSQIAFYALMNQYGIRPDLMRTTLTSSVSTAGLAGESTARIENALSKIGMQTRDDEGKKIDEFSRSEVAARLLGVTTSTYEKMAEKNMAETQIKLLDSIENLDVDRLTKNALGTGLFGSYAGREFSKLGAGGALETYREIQGVSQGSGGEVERYYQNTVQTLNDQWDLMEQRLFSLKEVFGEIFTGPVLDGVKGFSESVKGAVQWLTQIVDSSRNLDGTVNTWQAIGKIVDGLKEKFSGVGDAIKTAFTVAGIALVAAGISSMVGPLSTVAGAAAGVALSFGKIVVSAGLAVASMVFTGVVTGLSSISLAVGSAVASIGLLASSWLTANSAALTARLSFLSAWAAAAGPALSALAGITAAAAVLAAGLATIGYSLNPEKFTYFNQVATDALNGILKVAKQVISDISKGDWSSAATHLKEGFSDAWTFIKGINWTTLGNEIVTMIGDGARAIINTTLNLGGWIYDSLSSWVKGSGPYNLGVSIADAISSGVKTVSDVDYWALIKSAFKTVGDWLGLGWEIISGIGSGLTSGVSGAISPAANAIVAALATAAYEIQAVFARAWNTVIVAAFSAASSIKSAFSSVGTTIAGYIQPAIDAISSLSSMVSNIKIPDLSGAISNLSGNPITGYYNQDSGGFLTVDQYNARKAAGENTKGYGPQYAYGTQSTSTSSSQQSTGGNIYSDSYNMLVANKDLAVEVVKKDAQSVTSWIASTFTDYVIKPISNLISPAGYMTGGTGFVIDELQTDNEGYVLMRTDKNDPVTLFGNEKVSAELAKSMMPYLIDYETDTKTAGQNYADSKIPIENAVKPIKESADYQKTSAIETEAKKQQMSESGTRKVVDLMSQGTVLNNNTSMNAASYSSTKTISASDFMATTTRSATQESMGMFSANVLGGSLQIASAGNSISDSGFSFFNTTSNSGSTFSQSAINGGSGAESSMLNGGSGAESSMLNGASAIDMAAAKLSALEIRFSGDTAIQSITDFVTNDLTNTVNTMGSVAGSVLGGVLSLGNLLSSNSTTNQGTASDEMLVDNYGDMTCIGTTVMVPALKYTPPGGATVSVNPMDNNAVRTITGDLEGEFQDMSCVGGTVIVNGLKYTNPYGVSSNINPMDYINGNGVLNYQTAAQQSAKITVDAAKTSADYQKSASTQQTQAMTTSTQGWVTANEYTKALETVAAIENGNMWRNDLAMAGTAFAAPVNESTFNFSKAMQEGTDQAFDMFGTMITVNDQEYEQAMGVIEAYKAQTAAINGATTQLDGVSTKLNDVGNNFTSSFGQLINSLSINLGAFYGGGGTWGGTSKGGGGAYVGAYGNQTVGAYSQGYRDWGGTAASILAQSGYGSSGMFGSVSWGAKGSLIEEPSRIIAGEAGRELLLPNHLTELFLRLYEMGFNNSSGGGSSGTIVLQVNLDGEEIARAVSSKQKSSLNRRGLKLH